MKSLKYEGVVKLKIFWSLRRLEAGLNGFRIKRVHYGKFGLQIIREPSNFSKTKRAPPLIYINPPPSLLFPVFFFFVLLPLFHFSPAAKEAAAAVDSDDGEGSFVASFVFFLPLSPDLSPPSSSSFLCSRPCVSGEAHRQIGGGRRVPHSRSLSFLSPSSSSNLLLPLPFAFFVPPSFRRPAGSNGGERRLQRRMMLGRGKSFDFYVVLCAMLPSKVDSCFSLSSLDFHSAHPYDFGSDEFSGEDVLRQAMPSWIKLRWFLFFLCLLNFWTFSGEVWVSLKV